MSKESNKTLTEERAIPLAHVRKTWDESSVASGLTPVKLKQILADANTGKLYDYLTLAEEMEERDPHYASVIRTRKLAISTCDIHVESASDETRDVDLADAVRMLTRSPHFNYLLNDLSDGIGKGFSVCEIIWSHGKHWMPDAYKWRDQRWFKFAENDPHKLMLRDTDERLVELEQNKFIVHVPRLKSGIPARGGIARMVAMAYMCKAYTLADWMAFAELYGLPIRVGKYSQNATDGEKSTLRRAVIDIGTDAAAIIPDQMQIEFIQAANAQNSASLFENLADWLDSQISKAVLGQTMTTDSGGSFAQAKVHNEVRMDLVEADAQQLAATLNEHLVKPYININYGVQDAYPQIEIKVPEPDNTQALVDALQKLVPLGLKVEQSGIRDKLGIPDPDETTDMLGMPSAPSAVTKTDKPLNREINRAQPPKADNAIDTTLHELDDEWQPLMQPIVDDIDTLLAGSDSLEDFKSRLVTLIERDPDALIQHLAARMTTLALDVEADE